MCLVQYLQIGYLLNAGIFKPGELLKRYEIFFAFEENPETVLGNICYLSFGNVLSML